jgi:hypothetical protein
LSEKVGKFQRPFINISTSQFHSSVIRNLKNIFWSLNESLQEQVASISISVVDWLTLASTPDFGDWIVRAELVVHFNILKR